MFAPDPMETPCCPKTCPEQRRGHPSRGKKKKRLRAGFPTMNRRELGDEVVGVAGALAEVLLSKSVALPAPFPGAEVGIAPLQWNMQAFYMLIKPPPRSADLSG